MMAYGSTEKIWQALFDLLDKQRRGDLTKNDIESMSKFLGLCQQTVEIELTQSKIQVNQAEAYVKVNRRRSVALPIGPQAAIGDGDGPDEEANDLQ